MSKHDFRWDKYDLWMAISCFILGFLFMRMVFFTQQGWGVTFFTALFIGSVLAYVRLKNLKLTNEAWFWSGVLIVIAASFALWEGMSISALRMLLLFVAAIYWVLILTRTTQRGVTSDWLPVDILRGMLKQPLSYLYIHYVCMGSMLKGKFRLNSNTLHGIFGITIAVIFLMFLWPLLMAADTGGFQDLLRELHIYPLYVPHFDYQLVIQIILTFPAAAYMFALLAYGVHNKPEPHMSDNSSKLPDKIRIIPAVTIYTALLILNVFYVVFFITQAPYYVSAFRGLIPEGWVSYAEFARRGFFELIAISFLNSIFIAFSHLCIKTNGKKTNSFKILIIVLSLSSIFLTVTATA